MYNDLINCPSTGLHLGGNNNPFELDCNNHQITGSYHHGLMISASNVVVKNCIIKGFQQGMGITGNNVTNDFIYDQFKLPDTNPAAPHQMSPPPTSGIMQPQCDCLQDTLKNQFPPCGRCS